MTTSNGPSSGTFENSIHRALAEGVQSGQQPLDIIRDTAAAQSVSAEQSDYLAQVTIAVARAFGRAHGISLMGNAKALARIAVACLVAVREVHDSGRSELNLPDLAKADGKMLHLRETLTPTKLAALLAASSRPDGRGARFIAWLRRAWRRSRARLKEDWSFLMWTGKSKPTLSDKITNWGALAGTAIGLLFALITLATWVVHLLR